MCIITVQDGDKMTRFKIFALCLSLFFVLCVVGCGGNNGGGSACPETNVNIAVCDPESGGSFSLIIDNGFFPVVVGSQSMLEGVDDEGASILLIITVLDETEEVGGVTTRVLEEREFVDDELSEVSRNFFAQAEDGTVCYFGEEVDIFENGQIVSHQGTWRADENSNQAGIVMPADPVVGMVFSQEIAPGVAEDISEVVALGEPIVVPTGEFENTLTANDCNPLDGTTDNKVYVDGIGLAIDETAELVSF
jgi:hypothetical protein